MPLTPTDVANKQFKIVFRGYSLDEVDSFLDEVESELTRLMRDNNDLRSRDGGPRLAPATPVFSAAAQSGSAELVPPVTDLQKSGPSHAAAERPSAAEAEPGHVEPEQSLDEVVPAEPVTAQAEPVEAPAEPVEAQAEPVATHAEPVEAAEPDEAVDAPSEPVPSELVPSELVQAEPAEAEPVPSATVPTQAGPGQSEGSSPDMATVASDAPAEAVQAVRAGDGGRAALRMLQLAQQTAEQAVAEARAEADELLARTHAEVTERIETANAEATATLTGAREEAEQTVAAAKAEAEAILVPAQREAETTLSSARAEADRLLDDARQRSERAHDEINARVEAAMSDLDARRTTLEQTIAQLEAFEREYRSRLRDHLETSLRQLGAAAAAGLPAANGQASDSQVAGATDHDGVGASAEHALTAPGDGESA